MNMIAFEAAPRIMQAIDTISQGYTISHACKQHNITVGTFLKAVRKDATLGELLAEAVQQGHDALADSLIRPEELERLTGAGEMAELKLVSDNIKWLLSRRDQSRYGDAVTVTHHVTADKAVISALQSGMARAMARRIEQQKGDVQDATFEVVDDPLAEFR